jgi:catechol 2,3-dioxygenase-like lactoylglutathione lyase family enzyme
MQQLELLAFDKSGGAYPPDVPANDLRFQHFAIVVADMQKAYTRLQKCSGWSPITEPAPQLLPVSSGSVGAFKFRDPEGHPLELIAFAQENLPAIWTLRPGGAVFLGIDHSAISVSDTARSIQFYHERLGFAVSGGSCNRGIEQERLDGLKNTLVEVTALSPGSGGPPHLELLFYRNPAPRQPIRPVLASNDIAATRLILEMSEDWSCDTAQLIHDPDGHALMLLGHTRSRPNNGHYAQIG